MLCPLHQHHHRESREEMANRKTQIKCNVVVSAMPIKMCIYAISWMKLCLRETYHLENEAKLGIMDGWKRSGTAGTTLSGHNNKCLSSSLLSSFFRLDDANSFDESMNDSIINILLCFASSRVCLHCQWKKMLQKKDLKPRKTSQNGNR